MPIAMSNHELPNHTLCPDCKGWYEGAGYTDSDGRTVCPNCAELAGMAQCEDCNGWFDPSDLHDCDGSSYCEDCAERMGYAKCEDCGDWFANDDLNDCGGDNYCDSCADANDYHRCDDCGKWFSGDDLNDCSGNYYCERCMDRNGYVACYHCGEIIGRNDQLEGADNETYCDSCWCDRFFTCEDCGDVIWNDDAVWRNDGCYCSNCWHGGEEYEPRRFNDCDNTFNRIGHRAFGVEIETDACPDYEDYDGQGAFGAKEDGSINGKEFYSAILSGDKGLDEVSKLCDFAARNDWNVNSDCGLHVHFDMREENADSIKAIAFAMLATYDVWKAFVNSSRHSNHYCAASPIKPSELFGITDFRAWAGNLYSRYHWCNFRAYYDHRTIEIRLHHGSLNDKEICNWIRGISIFMDWAAKKGWKGVRDSLHYRNNAGKYGLLCQIWQEAGCSDLIEWFDGVLSTHHVEFSELAEVA